LPASPRHTARVFISVASVALAVGCGRRGGDDGPRPAPPASAESEAAEGQDDVNEPSQPGGGVDAGAAVVFRPRGRDQARVSVEVARTRRALERGLMNRTHLPPDAGMLFLFRRPKVQTFWMRDTLIPLDMIFVSSDMVVAGVVENAEPKTLTRRTLPGVVSQYVVEVNASWAREHGVEAGAPVEFIGVAALAPGEGED